MKPLAGRLGDGFLFLPLTAAFVGGSLEKETDSWVFIRIPHIRIGV